MLYVGLCGPRVPEGCAGETVGQLHEPLPFPGGGGGIRPFDDFFLDDLEDLNEDLDEDDLPFLLFKLG
jgi:hypothetical protein